MSSAELYSEVTRTWLSDPIGVTVTADRVQTTVNDPLVIGDLTMAIGMSIGIGSADGGADPEALYERVVREADDAMYADKAHRRR